MGRDHLAQAICFTTLWYVELFVRVFIPVSYQLTPLQPHILTITRQKYYTMKTALKYPANKIYVIRTSNVWSDFNTIDVMLGGHGNLSTVQNKVDHNSTRHAVKDSTVPSQMIPKLCCALVEEIDTYRYLLHRAVNPVHVMQMLNETYTMCNTSSLEDLVDTCPNYLLPTNYRI